MIDSLLRGLDGAGGRIRCTPRGRPSDAVGVRPIQMGGIGWDLDLDIISWVGTA